MFPPKSGKFKGPTKKSPIISPDLNDDTEQMGDADPVPADKGPTFAPKSQGSRKGPKKFRRTGLTRVDHNSFTG